MPWKTFHLGVDETVGGSLTRHNCLIPHPTYLQAKETERLLARTDI